MTVLEDNVIPLRRNNKLSLNKSVLQQNHSQQHHQNQQQQVHTINRNNNPFNNRLDENLQFKRKYSVLNSSRSGDSSRGETPHKIKRGPMLGDMLNGYRSASASSSTSSTTTTTTMPINDHHSSAPHHHHHHHHNHHYSHAAAHSNSANSTSTMRGNSNSNHSNNNSSHGNSGGGAGTGGDSVITESPVATLSNMGNTCFLNSVLYTLRFAPTFLHNLHHLIGDLQVVGGAKSSHGQSSKAKTSSLGRNFGGLTGPSSRSTSSKDLLSLGNNSSSSSDVLPKSKVQIVTEKLHELFVTMHNLEVKDSTDPYQPVALLQAIREANNYIFEGNHQQDAHELLVYLLDNLRETCDVLAQQVQHNPDLLQLEKNFTTVQQNQLQLKDGSEKTCDTGNSSPTTSSSSTTNTTGNSKLWNMRRSWKKNPNKIKKDKNAILNQKEASISEEHQLQTQQRVSTNAGHAGLGPSPANPTGASASGSNSRESGVAASLLSGFGVDSSEDTMSSVESGSESGISSMVTGSTSSAAAAAVGSGSEKNEKMKKLAYNFVAEDFEGITLRRTKCLECESVTERKEPFYDIPVPIPVQEDDVCTEFRNVSDIYRRACVTSEKLCDTNKYLCEKCVRYNEASRDVLFEKLPNIMVLQLKRFTTTSSGVQKVNTYLPTPLELKCFCETCCSSSSSSAISNQSPQSSTTNYNPSNNLNPNPFSSYSQQQQQQSSSSSSSLSGVSESNNDLQKNTASSLLAGAASNPPPSPPLHRYRLCCVIMHLGGSMASGHYIAYVKAESRKNTVDYAECSRNNIPKFGTSTSSTNSTGGGSLLSGSSSEKSLNILKYFKPRTLANAVIDQTTNTSRSFINNLKNNSSNSSNNNSANNNKSGGGTVKRTCKSLDCCGIKLNKNVVENVINSYLRKNPVANSNQFVENNMAAANSQSSSWRPNQQQQQQQGFLTSNNSDSSSSNNDSCDVWLECDDENIRPITSQEFEEELSYKPNSTSTPYLLFYSKITTDSLD